MANRPLFEGFEPPPTPSFEDVDGDEPVSEVVSEGAADPLDVLRHETRRRDRICDHNPLPADWPDGLSYFKGAAVRLCGIHVYYDFAWTDKFPHNRKAFLDGQALAAFVKSKCPDDKEAALLLTVRTDIPPGVRSAEKLFIAVVHIDTYLKGKQSPATAYFFSSLSADLETLQQVASNPQIIQQVLKDHVNFETICTWLSEDPDRVTALRPVFESKRNKTQEEVESLKALIQKWSAGEVPTAEIQSVVGALNDDAKLGCLISALAARAEELKSLPRLGQEDSRRMVAAALRASHRADALALLKQHIKNNVVESVFQKLLEANWWMLGTQYVGIVTERHVTTEENVDILLQRADGYFDLIELKRAKGKTFVEDHEKWIVSSEVNRAVNQTAHYIAEIEASRSDILRKKFVDLFKLHGFVIIGNLEEDDPHVKAKREALRLYNSHLHRVTVLTYDQLVRIAEEVVKSNEGEVKYAAELSTAQADTDCPEGQEEEPFDEDACQGDGGD